VVDVPGDHVKSVEMVVTFIAYSTRLPSGGVMATYELASGLSRLGHEVQIVHRWHPWTGDRVASLDDIGWYQFERDMQHHFTEDVAGLPPADFICWSHAAAYVNSPGRPPIPAHCGAPLMLVQGDLTGTTKLPKRLLAPFPKICVARWLVAAGIELGVPAHQLVHIPCGIRHDVYRLITPIADRPRRVAMLHSKVPKKGSADGIEALAEVRRRLPAVTAVVFGTRDPDEPLPSWIDYVRAPAREVLVRDIYNGSRVFLQPSIREGFGLTAVEAMAGGCALVTTANGGSEDYAFHGDTALVTEPRDVGAMADGIEQLLVDDALRTTLATRGNEYVKRLDWDASARSLETFLQRYGSDPEHYQEPPGAAQ
jgi:glycosyltransferase involved in cell wall biosynthesis